MEYIALVSLSIFSIYSCSYIIKKNGCLVSPYTILVLPNFIIIFLCMTLGKYLGYFSVSSTLIIYSLFFQFIFFCVELAVSFSMIGKKSFCNKIEDFYSPTIEFLSGLLLMFASTQLLENIVNHGFVYLMSDAFQKKYNAGITGHSLIFLQLVSGYHLAKYKKKINLLFFLWILILNFFTGVFHWIAFAFVGAFVYAVTVKSIKVNIRKIIILIIIGILFFVGSYGIVIIGNAIKSGQGITVEALKELLYYFRHFFNYLFAGQLYTSYKIEISSYGNGNVLELFIPVYNMLKLIIPSLYIDFYETILNTHWQGADMVIISKYGGYSNVPGIFGGMILGWDFSSQIFFLVSTALLANFLFIFSIKYKYLRFYACYYCVGLFFNWFVNFYNILEFYETILFWTPVIFFGDKFINWSCKYGKYNYSRI